jgi:hypothetical protein
LTELIGKRRNFSVSKRGDTVTYGGARRALPRMMGVLLSLPGLLMRTQMFLLPVLLGNAMCVRGAILQLRGPLVVLIMRRIIYTCRHMS